MPATMTTKAPVGPPIWVREPPSAEMRKSGDDCGVEAGLRRDAGSDGEGHGQRQRHESHRQSGDEIVRKLFNCVAMQTLQGAGKPPVR